MNRVLYGKENHDAERRHEHPVFGRKFMRPAHLHNCTATPSLNMKTSDEEGYVTPPDESKIGVLSSAFSRTKIRLPKRTSSIGVLTQGLI